MTSIRERIRDGELRKRKDATYRYEDPAGNVLVRKTKYGYYDLSGVRVDKDFVIENRPDPANYPCLWERSIGRYWCLLYRLPQLRGPVLRGDDVWLTEGEKDAEAGAELGCVTTTTYSVAMPANFVWFREFQGWVHIVADRDPAGSLIAARRAALLDREGVKWRFLLPAVRDRGADLYDHVRAGYGPEDFEEGDPERIAEEARTAQELLDHGGIVLGSAAYLEAQTDWEGSAWRRRAG